MYLFIYRFLQLHDIFNLYKLSFSHPHIPPYLRENDDATVAAFPAGLWCCCN